MCVVMDDNLFYPMVKKSTNSAQLTTQAYNDNTALSIL